MKLNRFPLACCLMLVLPVGLGCNGAGQNQSQGQSVSIAVSEAPKEQGGPVQFFGANVKSTERIVFVVDRSGSMVIHFDEVKMQLLQSVDRLNPAQQFHVVLFAEADPIESPPGHLVNATADAKRMLLRFLDSDLALPSGKTIVLPALNRAFKVLSSEGQKGGVICFLTDGAFSGIGGGSMYKGVNGNEAVVQWLGDNNRGGAIRVLTYLYNTDPEAIRVMKQIAKDNGGTFTHIVDD